MGEQVSDWVLGGPGDDEVRKLARFESVFGSELAAALEIVRRTAVRKTVVQNAGLAASAVVAQNAAHAWASAAVADVANVADGGEDGDEDAVVDAEDEDREVDLAVAQTVACNDGEKVRARATEPEEGRPGDILVEGRRHEEDGAMGP